MAAKKMVPGKKANPFAKKGKFPGDNPKDSPAKERAERRMGKKT